MKEPAGNSTILRIIALDGSVTAVDIDATDPDAPTTVDGTGKTEVFAKPKEVARPFGREDLAGAGTIDFVATTFALTIVVAENAIGLVQEVPMEDIATANDATMTSSAKLYWALIPEEVVVIYQGATTTKTQPWPLVNRF